LAADPEVIYRAGMEERVERKLAAILSADVKGYSRLMDEDEEATLHTLTAYRETIDGLIHQPPGPHRGYGRR
jgi:adenylate cyclase